MSNIDYEANLVQKKGKQEEFLLRTILKTGLEG